MIPILLIKNKRLSRQKENKNTLPTKAVSKWRGPTSTQGSLGSLPWAGMWGIQHQSANKCRVFPKGSQRAAKGEMAPCDVQKDFLTVLITSKCCQRGGAVEYFRLFQGMPIGAVALGNYLAVPTKAEHTLTTCGPVTALLSTFPTERTCAILFTTALFKTVSKLKTTQMSFYSRIHCCIVIQWKTTQEWKRINYWYMHTSHRHNVEWKKLETKNIYYVISCKWSLKTCVTTL